MNFIEIASPGCCSYEGVDPPPLPSCPHCAAVTHFQISWKFEMVVNIICVGIWDFVTMKETLLFYYFTGHWEAQNTALYTIL